ncbi:SnoaL-like polyketide cyclase [Nitrospirillum amazonense]|uniref:SnoaL-like polyketide cyclase n=1 Tax=Nitrospirillum amazonense TaxID=28077 RepID=A0A560K7H4_9PROT|nr:ester cyclase [Nitrospirillum amazonense]TWB77754.1 SnoaL-like polyketide cyclase [Nitrospirillum amazonense]
MAVRRTLDRMRALDRAWNDRRWHDYAEFLGEDLVAHGDGAAPPLHKRAHIDQAIRFCAAFPDARIHVESYLDLFSSHDGHHSCAVARLTGTASGGLTLPADLLDGPDAAPLKRAFDVPRLAICRWERGWIVDYRVHLDTSLMLHQLRDPAAAP